MTTVIGGASATGTVALTGPTPHDMLVFLSSNNPDVSVPAWITVPAGSSSKTFSVTTLAVVVPTAVSLTATSVGSLAKTMVLTVSPPVPVPLMTVKVSVSNASATVTLSNPAPVGGTLVNLPSGAIPSSVRVPAGQSSLSFRVTAPLVATLA